MCIKMMYKITTFIKEYIPKKKEKKEKEYIPISNNKVQQSKTAIFFLLLPQPNK